MPPLSPALPVALLPLKMLLATFTVPVPVLAIPPPRVISQARPQPMVLLPLKVLLVTVTVPVPALAMAPPSVAALLPLKVLSVTVTVPVPALAMAPPSSGGDPLLWPPLLLKVLLAMLSVPEL